MGINRKKKETVFFTASTLINGFERIDMVSFAERFEILCRADQHDLGEGAGSLMTEACDLFAGADRRADRGVIQPGIEITGIV